MKTKKRTEKCLLEDLMKKDPLAAERLTKATRFPLQEPAEIIAVPTDWHLERRPVPKGEGAASFVLAFQG